LRDFYHALATTYERAGREMALMLDTIERISGLESEAAWNVEAALLCVVNDGELRAWRARSLQQQWRR